MRHYISLRHFEQHIVVDVLLSSSLQSSLLAVITLLPSLSSLLPFHVPPQHLSSLFVFTSFASVLGFTHTYTQRGKDTQHTTTHTGMHALQTNIYENENAGFSLSLTQYSTV